MLDTEARAKVALVARVQDLGAGVAGVCVRLLRRAWVARAGEGVRGDRVNEKAARGPAGWCAASGMVRARRPSWGAGEAPRVRVKEVMLRRERERGGCGNDSARAGRVVCGRGHGGLRISQLGARRRGGATG